MPFFAAALFAVHPLLTESVSWISASSYPQYTFFFLAALATYILSQNRPDSQKLLYWSLFLFAFSVWISEKAVIFPLIIFCYGLAYKRKIDWKRIFYYSAIVAVWLVLFWWRAVQRVVALQTEHYTNVGLENPLRQIPIAIGYYIKLIFWPNSLTLYHTDMIFSPAEFVFFILILLALISAIFIAYKKNKPLFFWFSFYPIALLPTLNPFRISWIVAERYAYLGAIGLFVAIAIFIDWLIKKFEDQKNIIYALFAIIIILFSVRTIFRNIDWKNEDNLWIATGKVSLNGPNIHNNLGDVYARHGDYEKAAEEFKKSIEYNPGYADAYHNLGNAYRGLGKIDQAVASYQKAIELNPRIWQSHQNLSAIYYEQKNLPKALEESKKAAELNPNEPNLEKNVQLIESIMNGSQPVPVK